MSRTWRRCTDRRSRRPVPVSVSAVPGYLDWVAETRKGLLGDDPWQRRYFQTDTAKFRTKRRRRAIERLLGSHPDPELLLFPVERKYWYWADSIF